MKLQNYTLRYLALTLLIVIPIWAGIFYMLILDEVHDNIDDDLKNSKIMIIRHAFADKNLLNSPKFGINKFTIKPIPKGNYSQKDEFSTSKEFMEYDNDNQPIRTLKTIFRDDKGNPYELIIKASIVEEDELLEDLFLALIGLYVMLVISILAVNHLLLKKIWKSFHTILENLKEIKLGTSSQLKQINSPIDEFNILAKEVEKMLNRNEIIYSSQKQFIENASHELQTPLAISINKLELFAENNDLPDEQMMEIGKITDSLNRMTRLNKSLLMLSKIENQQFAEGENINFNELILLLTDDYADLAEFKKVKITITENERLYFIMNKGLAIALISNLLKNALIHNHPGGFVNFIINKNDITISNSGKNPPLNPDLIFGRFYRHTTTNESTGLGLSIVKSIINNYSITIEYLYPGNHQFKILFFKK
ncbi:HAMP domain-containing sensor histidine kinase [Flavobacterium branchiarum]|uniref:histidine kinase n=1 Tax=Flavobacterium branchiarum TaxID=1114870 RepID=A0ABV5FM37_9FLAO|nr:HAMP domain-containing sensor histidine kinase [Flavobacterium branchiarum]MDN3674657.1 HAMP domain-containing sensor histidine kinase [Flavobacterium branchiarum]